MNTTSTRWLLGTALVITAGCADGPMFALKEMNPYYRNQWAKDQELGPTYHERIEELRLLAAQIGEMSVEEQSRWIEHIDAIIQHDPNPEMRREAVFALKQVGLESATISLQRAAQDESDKVKMAVCETCVGKPQQVAIPILQQLVKDPDKDGVQHAAILALGKFRGEDVNELLAAALQDKSPATQQAATVALAQSTGMHYGGNVAKWKSFLAGETVEDERPSIAETLQEWNPFY